MSVSEVIRFHLLWVREEPLSNPALKEWITEGEAERDFYTECQIC